LYINVIGTGSRIEFGNIMLELFILLGLLFASQMIIDFLMTTLYTEKRHYRDYKYSVVDDSPAVTHKKDQ